jgi:hypothetical protein
MAAKINNGRFRRLDLARGGRESGQFEKIGWLRVFLPFWLWCLDRGRKSWNIEATPFTGHMTDKTIKFLALFLLLNIAVAGAFSLLARPQLPSPT